MTLKPFYYSIKIQFTKRMPQQQLKRPPSPLRTLNTTKRVKLEPETNYSTQKQPILVGNVPSTKQRSLNASSNVINSDLNANNKAQKRINISAKGPLNHAVDLIVRHHKFLPEQSSSSQPEQVQIDPYGQRMAQKIDAQLFKEYALVDLSQAQLGRVGCRWRVKSQVLAGKGVKICGNVRCNHSVGDFFQMNFAYEERGKRKNALVKIGLCGSCELVFKEARKPKPAKIENEK